MINCRTHFFVFFVGLFNLSVKKELVMDVEEMKSTVLQYSTIKNVLKHLQNQTKILRNKRNVLSEKMKTFMRYNQLELCHISEKVPTDIRKIRYVQRDKKSRVTLKMIETHFEQFFCNIDIQKFLQLTNKQKSEAFF